MERKLIYLIGTIIFICSILFNVYDIYESNHFNININIISIIISVLTFIIYIVYMSEEKIKEFNIAIFVYFLIPVLNIIMVVFSLYLTLNHFLLRLFISEEKEIKKGEIKV